MDQTNEEEPKDESEHEDVDFSRPSFIFTPKEHHEWRQQGPYVVCKSCELQHASWIGMEKILTGIDEEGRPILKNR